ncbi:MAG: BlaI/MecI/CopY family transcriptional regulator [Actinobacteria bacterium]|jgi:predicted transcriptional regulator|uniref:BlaI/MecI/CopY family transcriptional regulator n=1 Tax=Aquiluna sp. TaxID=2053504 RepID=UPI0029FBE9C1|nr:BlaI/MecI/CopY family transcriptional regulator [Aquiluna sp.]MDA0246654.1 BlaI/MecI/CopY family transcriptional regulator [Actinomycetota bacterium]
MAIKRKQGELESEVLGCLWDRPAGLTSQQILALLGDDSIKITTVLTVLSRLEDKNLVTKAAGPGRGFIFQAVTTREQHTAKALVELVGQIGNPAAVFSHFASGLSAKQLKELKEALDK